EDTGLFAKAEPFRRAEVEAAKKQHGRGDTQTVAALSNLGVNLLRQKKYAEAEPVVREGLGVYEVHGPDKWGRVNTQSLLGEALLGQEKYEAAESLLKEGYAGLKEREPKIPEQLRRPRLTAALERLVRLYEAWGHPDQAADWKKQLDAYKAGEK